MVATRQQSKKHQSNLDNSRTKDNAVHSMGGDDMIDSMSESGSEGSDWESRPSRSKNRHVSRKYARFSASPRSSRPAKRKPRKSLSLFITMPLDIMFEILSLLSPKDLLNLTQTSKPLRDTLTARNATAVWKSSRKSVRFPDCPPDFSEFRWASLFFGTKCQGCDAPGVLNIDFRIRRRVCISCKKGNLVVKSRFPVVFPDFDPVILDLIPYTNVGGWAHGRSSSSKFYWESDVDDMAQQWGLLQKNLHMRLMGARQKIVEFRAARIDLVAAVMEHAIVCDDWTKSTNDQRYRTREELRMKRYNAIIERFSALGYSDSEIEIISWHNDCLRGGELTERVWKRIQPILEPQIQKHRQDRILAAREEVITQRTAILKNLYKSYLKTILPSQWLYHPLPSDIIQFSVFAQLVNAENDVAIDEASFQEPMTMLPGLVAMWSEERKTNLRHKIVPAARKDESPDGDRVAAIDPIHLATSIFECSAPICGANHSAWGKGYSNPLFSWEGAVTHHCKTDFYYSAAPAKDLPRELGFSEQGFVAAEQLVSLAGLNPTSAIPADMDQLDFRFFCSHCVPRTLGDGSYGRPAHSWRSGVAHFMSHKHLTNPSWQLLTTEQAAVVEVSGIQGPVHRDLCWTCNHCTIYLDSWRPRQRIVEHLASVHNITNCHEPRDLFYFPNIRRSVITIPFFKLPQPPNQSSDDCGTS